MSSRYHDLESEFYGRYERPVIEPYIVGYSGIDPPLKAQPGDEGHEVLTGLLGGDDNGHYHLTGTEYRGLLMLLDYPPEIEACQEVYVTYGTELSGYEVRGKNVRRSN